MNELESLISNYIKIHDISKSEFLSNMGYSNINKACRKLSDFIENPTNDSELFAKIISASDISENELLQAIHQVQLALEKEKRRAFKPSLHIIPSGRPTPIFSAFILHIKTPDNLNELSFENQIVAVSKLFRTHQDKIKNPKSWAYGKGFLYHRTFDETLEFDGDCKLIIKNKGDNNE